MRRDDANEMGLAILVVVALLLLVDAVCLHVKCARQADALEALSERLELHINPPQEPTFAEKAAETYNKVKSAAVKGYEAAMEELEK